ncbi:MAG: hypothetical protein M3525_04625, partial [Acidobacteriota bacterium]|nr:hypothetical protein [Acidobacteriota bacterium]
MFGAFIVFPIAGFAQNPVSWSLESEAKGKTLKSGEKFKAKLKARIENNWYLYAVEQPEGGPYPTRISIAENLPFKIDGKSESPVPITKFDPNFNLETKYFAEQAEFNLPVSATAETNADELAVNVKYQVCDDKVCLPPKTVKVSFAGFEDARKSSRQSAVGSRQTTPGNQTLISGSEPQTPTFADSQNSINPINSTDSLWSFLWLAVTLGALSLLTPCVFPMIPITVSYFTNHSAGNRGKAVRMATVYSLGIIGTFTLIGMLLAIFVGAAGITL